MECCILVVLSWETTCSSICQRRDYLSSGMPYHAMGKPFVSPQAVGVHFSLLMRFRPHVPKAKVNVSQERYPNSGGLYKSDSPVNYNREMNAWHIWYDTWFLSPWLKINLTFLNLTVTLRETSIAPESSQYNVPTQKRSLKKRSVMLLRIVIVYEMQWNEHNVAAENLSYIVIVICCKSVEHYWMKTASNQCDISIYLYLSI